MRSWLTAMLAAIVLAPAAWGQECLTGSFLETGTKAALEAAGQQFLAMASRGDTAALKDKAIPALAGNFGGIEAAVHENQSVLAAAPGKVRSSYLLQAPGSAVIMRAEFFCGIANTTEQLRKTDPSLEGVSIVLSNLPPGTYGIVVEDVAAAPQPLAVALVLQQDAGTWKLAGLYSRPTQLAGHGGEWFLDQARAFKAKSQMHTAFLYYQSSWILLTPVGFLTPESVAKVYQEAQAIRPSDFPGDTPLELTAGDKKYQIAEMYVAPVEGGLGMVAKYSVPSAADTQAAYRSNLAVIKALVAKYPELREGFAAVVARAEDASGKDYGTLLATKDIP